MWCVFGVIAPRPIPEMSSHNNGTVPLAKFDNEEWDEFTDFQSSCEPNKNIINSNSNLNIQKMTVPVNDNNVAVPLDNMSDSTDNLDRLEEAFSQSLEDLVNNFDEKITKCFHDYEDDVDTYAPVQVRSQEEIINDCP